MAAAALLTAALLVFGGSDDDVAAGLALTQRDPAGDVFSDVGGRRVTSGRPQLDLRAASMSVEDKVLRLALTTEAPPRRGIFMLAAPLKGCDGGLIVEIRVEPGRAAAVRAIDPAHPHLRQVPGARATVAGTRLTATVPLREETELGRDWLVWSGASDDDFADSVPDWKGIDGVGFSRGGTPDYGSDCAHPKIRLIR